MVPTSTYVNLTWILLQRNSVSVGALSVFAALPAEVLGVGDGGPPPPSSPPLLGSPWTSSGWKKRKIVDSQY